MSQPGTVALRPPTPADTPTLFRIESDPEGRRMAAFGSEDSDSLPAFRARWERVLTNPEGSARVVLWNGEVVGSVLQFELFQKPSVAYWIDRAFWGRGIATRALTMFLRELPMRPLFARVAKDNRASRKVLENCGFVESGEDKGFARFRGAEIEELIYQLRSS
jgi:RimJ/RimL family protein N-acetyltransferase